jgi:hypothetical protein
MLYQKTDHNRVFGWKSEGRIRLECVYECGVPNYA